MASLFTILNLKLVMKRGNIISVSIVLFFVMISVVACFKSDTREIAPVIGPCEGTPGPLFTAVKNLVASKCVKCHNSVTANGGQNLSVECNIITSKTRIKIRAVDEGSMPPGGTLSSAEKATITNWINAGGKYTD